MTASSASDCIHLTVATVREIHREVIAAHGGAGGLRDEGLLESAVAAPQASFGGESPFANLTEVAAAYLFYLCRNHPFLDGNKRTAFVVMELFLSLNGWILNAEDANCISTMQSLAAGDLTEKALAAWLRGHTERE